jgi:hypothetical protein
VYDELEPGLQLLLRDATLRVVDRHLNPMGASFASEIVRCRASGIEFTLFCKYHSDAVLEKGRHRSYGNRHGVAYEAAFYRDVLQGLDVTTPRLYGAHAVGEATWLALEYLAGSVRVNKAPPEGMPRAARWLGRFHALAERSLADGLRMRLTRFDRDYYAGWASRTAAFTRRLHNPPTWLLGLCTRFSERVADELASMQQTIVHGEYYPRNILYRDGTIFPVDWESAAVGPGEIDLVTLTEGWDEETVDACHREYVGARWAGRAPACFAEDLLRAELYVAFRWLGDRVEWFPSDFGQLEPLRTRGEALGLI